MGWISGWHYRKKISIDYTKIDSSLSDLPVLVKLTTSNFTFAKANADGSDIRFTDSDGTTLLKFERERHTSPNADYWVKIPTVSNSTNTIFYMYYGKSTATDVADPTNVWDTNYRGVYHLNDLTTSTVDDATSYNHNGAKKAANQPVVTDGLVYKAQDFDGSDDFINFGDYTDHEQANISIELWVKCHSYLDDYNGGISKGTIFSAATAFSYELSFHAGAARALVSDSSDVAHQASYNVSDNNWHKWAMTYDGSNVILYKDGEEVDREAYSGAIDYTKSATNLVLGGRTTNVYSLDGLMEELRLSSSARSAAWMKATYNSENNTLVSYSIEEPFDVTFTETIEISDSWMLTLTKEYVDLAETLNLNDSWSILINPERVDTNNTINLSDSWTTILRDRALYAIKILHYNPLIFVTDTNPVKVFVVDITDPENPTWTAYKFNKVQNAKDIFYNSTFGYLYATCTDGEILKIDIDDFSSEVIDVTDTDDFQKISNLINFHKIFASNDNITGEVYAIDNSDIEELRTDIRFNLQYITNFFTQLNLNHGSYFRNDIRFLTQNNTPFLCDLRFFTEEYDELSLNTISRPDFHVYINGVEVLDVELDAITINHTLDTNSIASFKLARKHDALNYTLGNVYSEITNSNPVNIYIQDKLEFSGYISEISANSETESVDITAESDGWNFYKTEKILPMTILNTLLHPYDILLHSPKIVNPYINPLLENPKYFKGIKVDMGVIQEQQILRFSTVGDYPTNQSGIFGSQSLDLFSNVAQPSASGGFFIPYDQWSSIGGASVGKTAMGIMNGTFVPRQNWQYFWGNLKAYDYNKNHMWDIIYVGTSLSVFSTSVWGLVQVNYKYQKQLVDKYNGHIIISTSGFLGSLLYEDIPLLEQVNGVDEKTSYIVGEAPYKEISSPNGKLITHYKWVDEDDGLYSEKDESYDYLTFVMKKADLEYQKICNINGSVLPKTSANIEIMIDGYYYYDLKLANRINVSNTTIPNIYNNQNGFPLAIKNIIISSSSMRVTLTLDNNLSESEIDEIDALLPDENSELYKTSADINFVAQKFDPRTLEDVEKIG